MRQRAVTDRTWELADSHSNRTQTISGVTGENIEKNQATAVKRERVLQNLKAKEDYEASAKVDQLKALKHIKSAKTKKIDGQIALMQV